MSANDIAFARLPHVALAASSMPDLQRKARYFENCRTNETWGHHSIYYVGHCVQCDGQNCQKSRDLKVGLVYCCTSYSR